ncbi:unnamed protein product [Vitrella brassicaformis CCMP3155]|uniref:Uncharacterized protein n=1 Tax=Vitrella brassicaformis (strain CCMP3155) TaxID=1169540 RepID=A0A0G4FJZ9_VITBC|nr:unnamed protein product [Vitrella brassicaformis CCMP3155]|eukprot:CEM14097.1 unnamed protein product [Vitrella brassicaformis CCMP3155]
MAAVNDNGEFDDQDAMEFWADLLAKKEKEKDKKNCSGKTDEGAGRDQEQPGGRPPGAQLGKRKAAQLAAAPPPSGSSQEDCHSSDSHHSSSDDDAEAALDRQRGREAVGMLRDFVRNCRRGGTRPLLQKDPLKTQLAADKAARRRRRRARRKRKLFEEDKDD